MPSKAVRNDIIAVVPALNEADAIGNCLRSLLDDDPFAQSIRIFVADGGSTDATCDIVSDLMMRYPNLQLIDNPDRIQSAAINRAVDLSGLTQGILIRCDAHAVYPRGFLHSVVTSMEARPDAASVVTVLDACGSTPFQKAASFIVDTPLGSGGSAHRGGARSGWVDHGHHAGFRIEWFTELGGYDATFTHNEDAEYDYRLTRTGGRIWLDADLRIDYRVRSNLAAFWRQYYSYGRGRASNWQKHRAPLRLRQMVPALHTALLAVTLIAATITPWALIYPAFYMLVLALVSAWASWRLRSLAGAWCGPVVGAIHLGWGMGFLKQILTGAFSVPRQEVA